MREEQHEAELQSGASLRYLVAGVYRYRLLVMLTAAAGIVISALNAALLPDEYSSKGALFVRPAVRNVLTPESAFADTGSSRVTTRESIMNELQMLNSPRLFEKAVEIVGVETILATTGADFEEGAIKGKLHRIATEISEWVAMPSSGDSAEVSQQQKFENAARLLADRSQFRPQAGTSVIAVEAKAETPAEAQLLAGALMDAAVELHNEINESMGSLDKIEAELEQAETLAREAESRRDAFLQAEGFYDFEVQQSGLANYLTTLQLQLDATRLELSQQQAEVALLESLEKSMERTREVPGSGTYVLNPQVAALRGLLEQLNLRRADLEAERARLSVSGSELRERRQALEQLESETRERLAKAEVSIKLRGSVEVNPNYAFVVEALQARAVAIEGLVSKEAKEVELLKTTGESLAKLSSLQPRWQGLQLEARQKRENADRLLTTVTNMRAVRRLEQQKLSNLQVMHAATLDPICVGPGRTKQALLGGFVGGFLGLGLALGLAFFGVRVHGVTGVVRAGVAADKIVVEKEPSRRNATWSEQLPASLAPMSGAIADAFAAHNFDRTSTEHLKVASLPCTGGADAARAAGVLAVGLSALAGEQVVYVSCTNDSGWLPSSLGLEVTSGWTDVLDGRTSLEDALLPTEVAGLRYLGAGDAASRRPHPISSREFRGIVEELQGKCRVVVFELPTLDDQPAGRAVLGLVDGVQLVVLDNKTSRDAVGGATAAIEREGADLVCAWVQSRGA
jgi:uncharacterized protein involved in exopolysaccharide biosynthesis/Mrp family chromosome partitioning ATPase